MIYAGDKNSGSKSSPDADIIIAKAAGREIYYSDFIARAEYTFRPVYCKGNSNNDKNIVLNNLIAEKLLAAEAAKQKDNELYPDFINMINGRKEQKMRELLYRQEGIDKAAPAKSEIEKYYELSGRTYKVQYLNINNKDAAEKTAAVLREYKDSLYRENIQVEGNIMLIDSLPVREISWYSAESPHIIKTLFSEKLVKGDVIGPVTVNDTANLVLLIKGWTDEVAVTSNEIELRWTNVKEKLISVKADSIYDRYVLNLMGSRSIQFDPVIFNRLASMFAPFYKNRLNKKNTENDYLNMAYLDYVEIPQSKSFEDDYESLKGKTLFTVDGKRWTVENLKKEIDRHPLVFRKNSYKYSFAEQLKLAIVDLIRDKYLTREAYKRGLDKDKTVMHYVQLWKDAGMALFAREKHLSESGFAGEFKLKDFNRYLNPYIKELLKKYSAGIEINTEAYDKIKLTKTDMYTTQPDVPYKIYVPAFPQLTTYNRLDFGVKMNLQE
jgi:hypothetical protein